jgi:hypothetical protein
MFPQCMSVDLLTSIPDDGVLHVGTTEESSGGINVASIDGSSQ